MHPMQHRPSRCMNDGMHIWLILHIGGWRTLLLLLLQQQLNAVMCLTSSMLAYYTLRGIVACQVLYKGCTLWRRWLCSVAAASAAHVQKQDKRMRCSATLRTNERQPAARDVWSRATHRSIAVRKRELLCNM